MHSVVGILDNIPFQAALLAWLIAQSIKLLTCLVKSHRVDFTYLVSTGGMPSAHSASVCSLATSVGLCEGFDQPIFAVAASFAILTMFDASTVRWAAGQQAKILNEIARDFFRDRTVKPQKLKELLGHTRFQVTMGMITGIIVASIFTTVRLPK